MGQSRSAFFFSIIFVANMATALVAYLSMGILGNGFVAMPAGGGLSDPQLVDFACFAMVWSMVLFASRALFSLRRGWGHSLIQGAVWSLVVSVLGSLGLLTSRLVAGVWHAPADGLVSLGLWAFGLSALVNTLLISGFFWFRSKDRYRQSALVIGPAGQVERLIAQAADRADLTVHFVPPVLLAGAEPNYAEQKLIQDRLRQQPIDVVISICDSLRVGGHEAIRCDCQALGIGFNLAVSMENQPVRGHQADMVGSFRVIAVEGLGYSVAQRFFKRVFDIAAGLVGMIGVLALLPFLALAIKLDSPGPVFFRQKRGGKNGRIFHMVKFRSMYLDAEARKQGLMAQNEIRGHLFKIKKDPRITRVGRFLRKTSLDEIPQFWNVLKGEMSMVGTRPPTLDEYCQYSDHHRRRLCINPGLTGMWQVKGRGQTFDFEEVVEMDSLYIDIWSIWLDFKIIAQTFVVIFRGA